MEGWKVRTFGTASSQGVMIETNDGFVTIHTEDMSYAHELADMIEEFAINIKIES